MMQRMFLCSSAKVKYTELSRELRTRLNVKNVIIIDKDRNLLVQEHI